MISTPGKSSTRSRIAIAVGSSMSCLIGKGRNGLSICRSNRSFIASTGTCTQPDRRVKISSRCDLRRNICQSTATVRIRSLSARIRPSTSKIRPRSGASLTVRVFEIVTLSWSSSALTVWRNHNRTPSRENNITPTRASTPRRVARRSTAMTGVSRVERPTRSRSSALVTHRPASSTRPARASTTSDRAAPAPRSLRQRRLRRPARFSPSPARTRPPHR